jgi:O-antigen/teichoic acid export membrane protein
MDIKVSKGDIIWSYIAQFFNVGAGFITLPLVLNKLSTEEIAMNYLMMTIGAMVVLIDFGFSPQFGRNISYVFSGAQTLEKEGLNSKVGYSINYHLLKGMIDVAKLVYRVMSMIVLLIMLSFGTWYIHKVTNGFANVDNSLLIWIVYTVSVFFNIYFCYYTSLLSGRGLVKESKIAQLASKITYIALSYILILCGMGLLGLCIANFISPFVNRFLSYFYFYDKTIKENLKEEITTKQEKKDLFLIIWYNAKKLGLNFIGGYAILKFSMFIAGLYLTAVDVSSYGLLMQLTNIIMVVSTTHFYSIVPALTSYKVDRDKEKLITSFSLSLSVCYVVFIVSSIALLLLGPFALRLIGSNAMLPATIVTTIYLIITLLEANHSCFATLIATGNEIPYVKAGLISGGIICIIDIFILKYTSWGLLGIVIAQGLVQALYNNWKWPKWVCDDLDIRFIEIVKRGNTNLFSTIEVILKRRFSK